MSYQEEAWRDNAACATTNPDAFFPNKGESTHPAKRICGTCEVVQQCLAYALANNEKFGVWGNLTEDERKSMRRAKKAAAA